MPCHWTRDARKTNDGEDAASSIIVMTNNFVLVGAHGLLNLKIKSIYKTATFTKPQENTNIYTTIFLARREGWRGGERVVGGM